MGRRWAVEVAEVVVACAGLAWLFDSQPRPDLSGAMIGAILVVLGLIAVLQRVGPFAGMLDRVGLGRPRTSVERRLSFAACVAAAGSAQVLHLVRGDQPGFLFSFVWLLATFTVLMGFYRTARRLLLGAAF
jgi:hypothetical protein